MGISLSLPDFKKPAQPSSQIVLPPNPLGTVSFKAAETKDRADFSFKPVMFGGSKLLADQMVRFDAPVTPETAAMLSQAMVQLGAMKKQVGGSVKVLISNSPGGSVYHGFHVVDTMSNLGTPVDTIIMGGQTASMGALIFISGTPGRRFMSKNASLLIHRPSASGIGGTQNEISDTAREIERMRHRIDHLISQRSNIPVTQVKEMTDRNTIIYPLKALQLGLTDWVLVGDEGNKALSRKSIEGLSDSEIDERDTSGNYDDLRTYAFDPMLSDLSKIKRGGGGRSSGISLEEIMGNPEGKASDESGLFNLPSGKHVGIIPLPTPIKSQPEQPAAEEKPPGFDIYPYPRTLSVYA